MCDSGSNNQDRSLTVAARNGAARNGAARNGAARAARNGAARNGAARNGAARNGAARNGAARDRATGNRAARVSERFLATMLVFLALPLAAQVNLTQRNTGCVSCHGMTDSPTMHTTQTVYVSCVDCHGGNAQIAKAGDPGSATYNDAKKRAHPQPKIPAIWKSSANPVRPFTDWLKESETYIRFVNPGDLRVAERTCGQITATSKKCAPSRPA